VRPRALLFAILRSGLFFIYDVADLLSFGELALGGGQIVICSLYSFSLFTPYDLASSRRLTAIGGESHVERGC